MSCRTINVNYRGNDIPMMAEGNSEYPMTSSAFKIVHPYFDNYSEHIKKYDDWIYIAKSDKGSKTIKICKLNRLKEVEQKKREFITKHILVEKIVAASECLGDKVALSHAIKELSLVI